MSANEYYSNQVSELESALNKLRKQISFIRFLRLITFLSFVLFLILFFQFNYNYFYIFLSSVSIFLFLILIKINLKRDVKEKFLSNKLSINKSELQFLEYNYQEHDTGEEFNTINPHLTADFDIFGKSSLFQYLNRCTTTIGRKKIAENLCQSELDANKIINKQQAIQEIAEKIDFIQNFQAYGKFIAENGNEVADLQSWLNEKTTKIKTLQILNILIPLLNLVWIALIIAGTFPLNSEIIPILISLFIIYINRKKINSAHVKLGKTAKIFENYTNLIRLIEDEDFKTAHLTTLKQRLSVRDTKASETLTSLFKLLDNFDIRYNVIVSFILNSLMIFDIQILYRLIKWKEKHKESIPTWFTVISEIDSLISFATFAFNNKTHISYPTIADAEFVFSANEIGHPLLPHTERINNSIHFKGNPSVVIITGANMAGKSTFLRTLSINVILGMNGAPVCAKEFQFTPCDIMSSIKIQDSLSNNVSYFYAELIRLKEIIAHVKANPRTLVVLDEILRGTNTKDKQLGSLGLVEKLISLGAIVIIATHDLVIGELEKQYPDLVTNHCFEVELTNDQLIFDYKLKDSISQKLNASFLMKKWR
ncbi:MAG: hypothetical protein IPO21_03300 [Bacteroidales bacterium]|nr:hypothetical protein [Bacteroidales bacterium]